MPKISSIIQINGTLGEMTFYTSKNGNILRRKGGVSADRIATDDSFKRTRENGVEFGSAAASGKLLRNSVRSLMVNASDSLVTSRLTQVMALVKNNDLSSARGDRNVAMGLTTDIGKQQLVNFNFNIYAELLSVLKKPYSVDATTGSVGIVGLVPEADLVYPEGSTHVVFKGAWLKIDFSTEVYEVFPTNTLSLPLDKVVTDVALVPTGVPSLATGNGLIVLSVEFGQVINGNYYPFSNSAFNALTVLSVS